MVSNESKSNNNESTSTSLQHTGTGNRGRSTKLVFLSLLILAVFCVTTLYVTENRLHNFLSFSVTSNLDEKMPSFGPPGWSDVKFLLYMTTHFPDKHVAFLPCWKDAAERLDIFKYADLMLYTAVDPTEEQLKFLPFRNTIIKRYENNGYQEGAVQAMLDPYLDDVSWFDDYDWVMRVNPDVLIRADGWLMQTMLNTSIDMIVHECFPEQINGKDNITLHTDFFAIRPRIVDREVLLAARRDNAEYHFSASFRKTYDEGRFAYVEGAFNVEYKQCRIGGVHSPVLHIHALSNHCPYYYNVTKEGAY